jgi:SAM-dependent methyltransferase
MVPELGTTTHTAPGVNDMIIAGIDRELAKLSDVHEVKILDLGAGEGYITYQLLRALDRRGMKGEIVSIDIDYDKFEPKLPGVTFKTQNLDGDFSFGKFDFVIAADVIEHLRSPYGFLKNCFENLKPHGIIYVSTPNVTSVSSLLKHPVTGIPSFFDMNIKNEHISPSPKWLIELLTNKICDELGRTATIHTVYNRNIVTTAMRRKGKRVVLTLPVKPNRFFGETGIYKITSTS